MSNAICSLSISPYIQINVVKLPTSTFIGYQENLPRNEFHFLLILAEIACRTDILIKFFFNELITTILPMSL